MIVVAILAGCLAEDGTPGPRDDGSGDGSDGVFEPASGGRPFGWTAFVGDPSGPGGAGLQTAPNVDLRVPDGASALRVEVEWTCDQGACPMNLYLTSPSDDVSNSEYSQATSGDSSAAFDLAAPEAGTWTVSVFPVGASGPVAGTVDWAVT